MRRAIIFPGKMAAVTVGENAWGDGCRAKTPVHPEPARSIARKIATGWPATQWSRVRRLAVAVVIATLLALAGASALHAEIVLTDAVGREVRLKAPAQRIVLGDSLLLLSLAMIDRDPISRIAGWSAPLRLDEGMAASFRKKFPAMDAIPDVGGVSPANSSAEGILSVRPDLFVVSSWQAGWETIVAQLEAANVPVIFLDNPADATRNPIAASARTIEILGAAIGRSEQAQAFASFIQSRYQRIIARLGNETPRPRVLMDAFASSACCSTPGKNNRLTQLIADAGGISIGAAAIAGYEGRLDPEYVLGAEPQVYIATGGPRQVVRKGVTLGGSVTAAEATASLAAVVAEGVKPQLPAVRNHKVHGVLHQMTISALQIVALENFARWIHPELFADVDPAQTMRELNDRFLAAPITGVLWTELPAEAGGVMRPDVSPLR